MTILENEHIGALQMSIQTLQKGKELDPCTYNNYHIEWRSAGSLNMTNYLLNKGLIMVDLLICKVLKLRITQSLLMTCQNMIEKHSTSIYISKYRSKDMEF